MNTAVAPARQSPMSQAANRLAELNQRREALQATATRFQVLKEQSQHALEEASRDAEEQFGTSDTTKLREMYQQTMTDNNEKLRAFEEGLSATESAVQDISTQVGANSPSTAG